MTLTLAFYLAFYIGKGGIEDRLIRAATRSGFSHVELIEPYEGARKKTARALSSSPRDGGVRVKEITFELTRWEFVDLSPWHRPDPWARGAPLIGARYDWPGILLTFALPLRIDTPGRWFCSELIGGLLGLSLPGLLSPGDLYWRVRDLNRAYEKGHSTALQQLP